MKAINTVFAAAAALTTPPCSEGVNGYVMQQPIQVGLDQAVLFSEAVGNNARPLQAKNSRLLLAPAHSTN